MLFYSFFFFFSSRRRHTRYWRDWSSDVCFRSSFQVAPDADFAAYAKELSGHGIKSEQRNGISPGAARALTFTDMKGTVIELYADYVFARDDGKQATITPLKLGHVAHRVADVQKVVKFYTEVMGFRV